MKVLVLDFGGSSVKYSVIDSDGTRTNAGEAPAPVHSPEEYRDCVVGLYEQFKDIVEGIAISMAGIVKPSTGELVMGGAYLPLWGKNIFDLICPHLPVPVSLMNDGKAAALAEAWNGSLSDIQDGAVFIIGSGLAGGIILNRQLLMGHGFAAGEFSYMHLTTKIGMMTSSMGESSMSGLLFKASMALGIDYKKCAYYGNTKGWDSYMRKCIEEQTFSALNDEPRFEHGVDGRNFMELVNEGNEIALQVYDEFLEGVYTNLSTIQAVLDPEVIAVGGGITHAPRFIPDLAKKVEIGNATGFNRPIVLRPCTVTGSPNEYGAAYHFFRTNGILQ